MFGNTFPDSRGELMAQRILLVDDEEGIRKVLGISLTDGGYEVSTAENAEQALDIFRKEQPAIVLTDIKMPGMDGIDTFKKLKEISPKTPTIMMTAFAVEDRIREGLKRGAFGAFQKPINYDRLFCSIERAFPGGALVMIADNNKEFYSGLYDVLVEKGYRVITAIDGEIAVQLAREKRFDIIILNNQLQNIDGTKVYPAIRNIRPDVPVINITGNKEEAGDIVNQLPEKGVYVYLEKPLDMDHLLEVIQKALENRC